MSIGTSAPLPKYDNNVSLHEIFNREAARALKEYPQLRGKFLLVNGKDGRAYGQTEKSAFADYPQHLRGYIEKMAQQSSVLGPFSLKDPDTGMNVISYGSLPFRLFTKPTDSAEKEILAVLDHELGHLVVGGSMMSQDPCYRECAADAFAILRHMQRYGTDTDIVSIGGWRRAFDFVMTGHDEHFTTLAIQKIEKLKDKIDFKSMTPDQMRDLAMRIALDYTPHSDITNGTAAVFAPVRESLEISGGDIEYMLRVLARITTEHKDNYHVFKIGSCVLNRFLDGKVMRADGQPFDLSGPFWDNARREIARHAGDLASNGILMGMPLKGQDRKPENESALESQWEKAAKPETPRPAAPPRSAYQWRMAA